MKVFQGLRSFSQPRSAPLPLSLGALGVASHIVITETINLHVGELTEYEVEVWARCDASLRHCFPKLCLPTTGKAAAGEARVPRVRGGIAAEAPLTSFWGRSRGSRCRSTPGYYL